MPKTFRIAVLLLPLLTMLAALSLPARAAELPNFADLVERVKPAVVNISTTQKIKRSSNARGKPQLPEGTPFDDLFRHFFEGGPGGGQGGPDREASSLGSGFIISADGYILTNHHVVHKADEIVVKLNDRRELVAEVIGSDERSDLALLKIEADNLPVVKFAQPDALRVGEWVLAIGSPYGFEYSVTQGIVSAKGRVMRNQQYVPLIQTDVAINPGNSGGPLFNLDGEVVGINSMIYTGTGGYMGLSFSIPVGLAQSVIAQLREDGTVSRGWLGVLLQQVDRELAEAFGLDKPRGAAIRKVFPDSPAAAAGLQVEDVIIRYNDRPVPDVDALPPMVGATPAGDSVIITVIRGGVEKPISVKIGELDEEKMNAAGGSKTPKIAKLGLRVKELSEEELTELEIETAGVKVVEVDEGAGREAGLRKDDVILKVNSQPLDGIKDLTARIDAAEPGKLVRLFVLRRGTPLFLALRVPEEE